ncbi:YceD family protein [Streptococcus ovuberis]|uniref:DUF177 domain-containing protein n=1 Tax=Streptococcus ovuberis TaxID=1936207 RepID=A0A7X6S1G5_9STRE|nr:DUF177 domain-containing protein [Streptococcus ovuberis]NKZ21228.1 DUF177 domain-containing protein [Streptococcus ovuberis]
MFHILDIKKNKEGLSFKEKLDLKADLQARNSEILDIEDILVEGTVTYQNNLYVLDYQLSYSLTMPSSRSMTPVKWQESYPVSELFMEATEIRDLAGDEAEELFLPIEGDMIDLSESVADNILLNIPLKILTPEEEANESYPEGKDWQVMSQEDYEEAQTSKKEAQSPFAGLAGLFDED